MSDKHLDAYSHSNECKLIFPHSLCRKTDGIVEPSSEIFSEPYRMLPLESIQVSYIDRISIKITANSIEMQTIWMAKF